MRKRGAQFKRRVNPHAMYQALRSVEAIEEQQTVDLGIAYWQAFAAMRGTWAAAEHWHTLAAELNIAMLLSEAGVMPQALGDFKEAQLAIVTVGKRAERSGKLGFNSVEFSLIKEALQLHDLQLKAATKQQALDAVREAERRQEAGHVFSVKEPSIAD